MALGLVLGGAVTGLAGVRTDPRFVAIRGALDQIRTEIDLVHGLLDGLQLRVRGLETDLGALRNVVTAADSQLRSYERVLEVRRDQATEVVTTGRVPGRPAVPRTLADLRSPLVVVNRAVYANDQLGVALVDEQSENDRRLAEVRSMLTNVREASFQLQRQERVVRAKIVEAIRSAYLLGEAAGDPALEAEAIALVDRAREELHRIDLARTELRSREQEVLEESIALDARADRLRLDLRDNRESRQALYAEMTIAELLVSSRLGGWEGLGDYTIALDGVLRVCPVDQPMSYSDNWHAPRWGGGFHLHQGIDIFAPTGTPIRAPFDGTAVVADNWLGGLAVKVYGETGYVYNAHLSQHGLLGEVEAGDIIGFVGSTGNASGPHNHFEYHPGNGEAVNPYLFLNAVC